MGFEPILAANGGADPYRITVAIMQVEKVYKGLLKVDSRIKVLNGDGGSCTAVYQQNNVGEKFLVFIGEPGLGDYPDLYVVGLCGRSKSLVDAGPDLVYLDNRRSLVGKTRLSGIIRAVGENTPLPSVSNLKVTVIGRALSKELTTNEKGFFDLWDIRPGVYTVKYQLPFGWKLRGNQLIPAQGRTGWIETSIASFQVTIFPKKHTEIRSIIEIDNSISGKVLSPERTPMKGVCVSAYWLTPTSNSFRIPDACTNENGEFSIDQLPPGKYRIEINSRGLISGSNPFEKFYYPGTIEEEHAEPVTVGAGLSVRNLVIQVKATVPLIRVSGVLQLEDGGPIEDTEVKFNPEDEDRYEGLETDTDRAGRFAFELPQGAAGRLRAEVNIFDSRFDKCPDIISLRPSRTGKGPQSTFDFRIDGKTSKDDVKLIIHLRCSLK